MSAAARAGSAVVAGIIGRPVEHSLSPVIHNAAYRAVGLDWVYVPFEVTAERVGDAMAGMRGLGIRGLNVTMPHKRAVMRHLDETSEEAARVGAVNTITRIGDRLVGANTDGPGFLRFLHRDAGFDPGGRRALVLGAGGAARAVAVALAAAGSEIAISARRPGMAQDLAREAGWEAPSWTPAEIGAALSRSDLLVNATPGSGSDLPVPESAIPAGIVVVDLIYAPPATPLLESARAAGARAFNGVGMLLQQAALSFEIWTGVPAPLEAMSAALVRALGRRGGDPATAGGPGGVPSDQGRSPG
ncbi:MAG: shikimate dehydrogenase [Acidobacteria bacterium]|nr:shikimate dehydrogenase [Acidobacteriota bacterium]